MEDVLEISEVFLKACLPPRPREAHKGQFGHVLVLGGDHGMGGAVRMTAEAAARVGSGLVTVATRPQHAFVLSANRPELMSFAIRRPSDLEPLLQRSSVLAMGPGLGRSDWAKSLFDQGLTTQQPKVIDADALNLLAIQRVKREDWVLTPHPGEAARLLDVSSSVIQGDRIQAVYALQKRYGGCVVLKGAGSLVLGFEGQLRICRAGNAGMASGGMGDILTGVIAGLIAQGLSLFHAAAVGVYLHAKAGDIASRESGGERGLLACDLFDPLHRLVNLC